MRVIDDLLMLFHDKFKSYHMTVQFRSSESADHKARAHGSSAGMGSEIGSVLFS